MLKINVLEVQEGWKDLQIPTQPVGHLREELIMVFLSHILFVFQVLSFYVNFFGSQ